MQQLFGWLSAIITGRQQKKNIKSMIMTRKRAATHFFSVWQNHSIVSQLTRGWCSSGCNIKTTAALLTPWQPIMASIKRVQAPFGNYNGKQRSTSYTPAKQHKSKATARKHPYTRIYWDSRLIPPQAAGWYCCQNVWSHGKGCLGEEAVGWAWLPQLRHYWKTPGIAVENPCDWMWRHLWQSHCWAVWKEKQSKRNPHQQQNTSHYTILTDWTAELNCWKS